MSQVRVNTPGMAITDPGYISSITIYTDGLATALVPDGTTGEVTVEPAAATKLTQMISRFVTVTG